MSKEQKGQRVDQPFSPKLRMALEEMKAIFEKYDVAGIGILYEPGFSEYDINIGPSWSVVGINDSHKLQFNPPLEDPKNPNASKAKIAETVNMLANLRLGCTRLMMTLTQAENATRQRFGIKQPQGTPIVTPGKNGHKR
jgi:hypothetical protein